MPTYIKPGTRDYLKDEDPNEELYKKEVNYFVSSTRVIDAIVKYYFYLGVSIDIIKYQKLLENQKGQSDLSFSHLVRNLVNKHPEIRDALICIYPDMTWAPVSLQRDGKNPLVLKVIAELLWNDAPISAIIHLIPHIYNLRKEETEYCRYCRYALGIRKEEKKINYINYDDARRHYNDMMKKRSEDFKGGINLTKLWFIASIFQHKGYVGVEELDYLGIIQFTSHNYIKRLLEFESKSYKINQFLEFILLHHGIFYKDYYYESNRIITSYHFGIHTRDDLHEYLSKYQKITINPYSILLSSVISKSNKIMWLEEQVKSLKKSGNKSYIYRDEALKWFHIKRSIKSIAAFSIGKFRENLVDVRIDDIMVSISSFLGLKLKT
jgi:hypothetical protein